MTTNTPAPSLTDTDRPAAAPRALLLAPLLASALIALLGAAWALAPDVDLLGGPPDRTPLELLLGPTGAAATLAAVSLLGVGAALTALSRRLPRPALLTVAAAQVLVAGVGMGSMSTLSTAGYLLALAMPAVVGLLVVQVIRRYPRLRVPVAGIVVIALAAGALFLGEALLDLAGYLLPAFVAEIPMISTTLLLVAGGALWAALAAAALRSDGSAARLAARVTRHQFYLREGLLAPGRQTSRTTAEYDESHVERIRLVRALTDAGGLGIVAVRRIVEVLDAPGPARLDLLATAQHALLADEPAPSVATAPIVSSVSAGKGAEGPQGADAAQGADAGQGPDGSEGTQGADGSEGAQGAEDAQGADDSEVSEPVDGTSPAREWLSRRGWHTYGDDLLVARLERVWAACEAAGIQLDDELMDGYAEALEQVACLDVDTVPEDPDEAVRRVVVGTVMLEPVLLTLRLLAQRELSVRRAETVDGGRLRTDLRR